MTSFEESFEPSLVNCTKMDMASYNFSAYDFPRNTTFVDITVNEITKILGTIIVIIAALIGNIAIILVVLLNRGMRTTINLYLVNLALADLFICTFCMTVYLINDLTEPLFIHGAVVCKLNAFGQMTSLTASVLTLAAISCDRFIAILYPLQARYRVTKQRTGIIIVGIWITSVIVSLPFLFVRTHFVFTWRNFTETNCSEVWPESVDPVTCARSHPLKKIYYTFVTVALFFIPLIIMTVAYSCIAWKLWANVTPGEVNEANAMAQDRAKKRVIKMVFIMVIAFILCWSPFQVVVLYSEHGDLTSNGEIPLWFSLFGFIGTFLAYTNSAVNPVIYGGFNQGFRDAIKNILKCQNRRSANGNLGRNVPNQSRTVCSTVNYTPRSNTGRCEEAFTTELVELNTIEIDGLPKEESEETKPLSPTQSRNPDQ